MNLEQERARAQQALRLLDDPLFKEAREDVYAQLRMSRIAAPTTQSDLHTKLILMEQLADRFFRYFELLAQTGQFAQIEIDRQEAQRKSFADRMQSYISWGRSGI